VTLARGRFTSPRHPASPTKGTLGRSGRPYGEPVVATAASAPARSALAALLATCALALFLTGSADGVGLAPSALLGPASACQGANDARASAEQQMSAVACLINQARSRERRAQLGASPRLTRAAALKGRQVASCNDFSHTPCGTEFTSTFQRAGYRYSTVGENLYAGPWGRVTPREVVLAWLKSPGHRANMLSPGFRQLGAAPVRAPGLLGNQVSVVWTATFGTPR
jgi:uncharacterized protein YkwD